MDASYNSWRLGIVSFTGVVPATLVCLTITGVLDLIFDSWVIWPCWERTEAGERLAGPFARVCVCMCNFFFLILRFCFSALGPLFCIPFCDVNAGILPTSCLLATLVFGRLCQQECERLPTGPETEGGTCFVLSASSSQEAHLSSAPGMAAGPSCSSSWIHFPVFPTIARPASLHRPPPACPWHAFRAPGPEPLPFFPSPRAIATSVISLW